ncbi:MAG TPA: apolipoprotein N-acyltransferase, partial [Pseudodesulfovibrio sp.]|nr:apolipoprotein N-acyltransferase [Pseudodesulfovibrio sp.]
GLVYYPLQLYWILIVLGRYGQLSPWITVPALGLLALYMSLYLVGFSVLTSRLEGRPCLIWLAPIFWVGLDWLRSWLFTGFPWIDLGYTQYRYPLLIQVADLAGHHAVTFLIVMVNCILALGVRNFPEKLLRPSRPGPALVSALLLLVLATGYNLVRHSRVESEIKGAETLKVAVVQGNIPQDEKWQSGGKENALEKYLRLTRLELGKNSPKLVVWPETAMPFYLRDSAALVILENLATRSGADILTGAPYRQHDGAGKTVKYYNSAFLIDHEGLVAGRYDKEHLVPFGEYVPLKKLLFFLGPLVESVADFSPGLDPRPIPCQKTRVGVLICFESIFPDLARRETRAGAELLVNLTNDAWYGRSSAPWQHLSMAVFRSVENRRSLARAANTGVSGFIDPLGGLHRLSPLFEDYSDTMSLPLLKSETFFNAGRGYLAGPLCLALTVLVGMALKFRKSTIPC